MPSNHDDTRNPLLAAVARLLSRQPQGCSEFELIKSLELAEEFPPLADEPRLALFQKHFLVMNALYRLQQSFWQQDGLLLSISALRIALEPVVDSPAGSSLPGDGAEAKLRDYYLDWANYQGASTESVEQLLNEFWRRYCSPDKRQAALACLQLPADADTQQIKQQYRRLAAQHHPDKGGDAALFIELREAYEMLR
ncbi:DNA-J related domain-containing protein [Marinobacterium arenosum]|uniref:DNA-J related domain-containing protein n=1 Tax=Marinobacterium arenosum TaxID=2862496 RepID=UPI001C975B4A|nr:DNA-J related domain-containing protein [Marinobacterium arenosum]MBY4675107.1 DnaJ domain-containing protein [Marinobacterium arenosum]